MFHSKLDRPGKEVTVEGKLKRDHGRGVTPIEREPQPLAPPCSSSYVVAPKGVVCVDCDCTVGGQFQPLTQRMCCARSDCQRLRAVAGVSLLSDWCSSARHTRPTAPYAASTREWRPGGLVGSRRFGESWRRNVISHRGCRGQK